MEVQLARSPGVSPRAGAWRGPGSAVSRPTGVLVLLSLDYMTSVFYFIPKTALAAVIITAVVPLVDTSIVGTLWRVKSAWLLAPPPAPPLFPDPQWRLGAGGPCGSGRCHLRAEGQAASFRGHLKPAPWHSGPPLPWSPQSQRSLHWDKCWLLPVVRLQPGAQLCAEQPPAAHPPSPPGLDLLPLAVTFLLCFWEVQYGILAGTVVSTLTLLYSAARPKIQVQKGARRPWAPGDQRALGGTPSPCVPSSRSGCGPRHC